MPTHATFSLNKDIILFIHHASGSISILCRKDINMPVQHLNNQSLGGKEHRHENPKKGSKVWILRLHPSTHFPFTQPPTKTHAIVPDA